jgi:GNAT superfamily N-acetyltransferase
MARDIAQGEGSIVVDTMKSEAAAEPRSLGGRDLAIWAATVIAFPLAGVAARAVVGPVDAIWTAVLAGAGAGALIGTAQWLVLRRIGARVLWIAATGAGLGIGLGLAYEVFGYGTTAADLAVVGAATGLGIGVAQWWLLRDLVRGSVVWIPATAIAWALGWAVTTAIGVDPDDRWAVPGLSGALTITVLTGGVLWALARSGLRARASS